MHDAASDIECDNENDVEFSESDNYSESDVNENEDVTEVHVYSMQYSLVLIILGECYIL